MGVKEGEKKEFSKVDISLKAFVESQSFTASILFGSPRVYLTFLASSLSLGKLLY